jgi:pimeloyl-ACP methyl ester carboxylesterase
MNLNHVRRGTGEPLVLIHGIGHRWQAWLPVFDRLAAHHEVVAIDLPGFGGSPVPPRGTARDMATAVAMLAEFFASAGLGTPHVAGNSLGGGIALELAAAGLVRSATALAPVGFFTLPQRLRAVAILSALRGGTFLPAPLIEHALRVDAIRAACFAPIVCRPRLLDPRQAAEDALALRRARGFAKVAWAGRRYRFVGAPSVPVTIGWGTRDRILPPAQAQVARERLPRARHVALEACGHVPMSDDPDRVATLILHTTGAVAEVAPR